MLTQSLPYWPINPSISTDPWFNFQLDLVRCLWAMLPGAILWGASFPLALASVATGGKDPARLVGGVYAANTVGAIVGSVTRQPAAGRLARQPARAAGAGDRLGGLGAADARVCRRGRGVEEDRASSSPARCCSPPRWAAPCCWRERSTPVPGVLVAYGRYAATRLGEAEIIYIGEGWNASVAVSRLSNGVLNYHNAGKVQASSEPQDMRLQRMLGHMTTLIPKNPESVLVIGCGAGVTAGAVSIDPDVEQPDDRRNRAARAARRLEVFRRSTTSTSSPTRRRTSQLDDARHFLLTTQREVRRDHVGSARPVGEGRGDALHARSSSRP